MSEVEFESAGKEEVKPQVNSSPFPITVKLQKPVMAHGDEISELVFREPTGGDIERVGNPVNIDPWSGGDRPRMTFDSKSMTQMMGLLALVPPSTIRQLHPQDWNTAAWALANFFMPDLQRIT